MSQTTEDQTTTAAPPTSEEVIGKVNESITALQSAQQTVVEGANLLGDHVNDPNAHGAAVPDVVMREMPQPAWNGTSLTFQKADGTQIVAPVNLKGEPGTPGRDGTPGPVGPRPEHQWSGTELKIQNADGSWPESGTNLKGEPGEVANLSDAVDSDSSSTAASSRAVKTVNDKALAAQSSADNAMSTATAVQATANAAKTSAESALVTADNAMSKAEQALAGGGGSGGGIGTVMAAPTVNGPENLALGVNSSFSLAATPGLKDTYVVKFEVSLTGQAQTVTAADNAGEVIFHIPMETGPGVPMTLTVTAVDNLGNRSLPAVLDIQTAETYVAAPVFISPESGQSIDPVNIIWEMGPFEVVGSAEDTHMTSRYRIVDDAGAVVYDSGVRSLSSELTAWTAAAPEVRGGAYKLQAAYRGQTLGWSAWAEQPVEINGVKTPSLVTPANGAEVSHYYVTFGTSAFALETSATTNAHVASQYRILSQDGQTILYDSGEVTDLLRHVVVDALAYGAEPGGQYLLDARHKGATLGWSDWSAPVSVRVIQVEQFENEVAYTSAGSANFVVPDDITQVRVLAVGGGGGGIDGEATSYRSGGSGGAGGKGGGIVSALLNVTPGQVIPLVVGRTGSNASYGTSDSAGQLGGDSTFGAWITAGGGRTSARGVGTTALAEGDDLICNLAETPCAAYKSCGSFREMSLNQWTYDVSFSAGAKGRSGESKGDAGGAGGAGGSGGVTGGYGYGGNGGDGGTGGDGASRASPCSGGNGGAGGAGGYGGGKGGNGGNGGYAGNGGSTLSGGLCNAGDGGNGGDGGNSKAMGGDGGSAGNGGVSAIGSAEKPYGGYAGNGGNGGTGGYYGGIGGNGGNGRYGGNGGNGGYGGAGGKGGWGGGYGVASLGGKGGKGGYGGPGCVVVFF